jgi:hypothetical protein
MNPFNLSDIKNVLEDAVCGHCDHGYYDDSPKGEAAYAGIALFNYYKENAELHLNDSGMNVFIMEVVDEPSMTEVVEVQCFLDTTYGPLYYAYESEDSDWVQLFRIGLVTPSLMDKLKIWLAKRCRDDKIPASTFYKDKPATKLPSYKRVFNIKHRNNDCYLEDPYVPALLQIGNVELNPGPVVSIPKMGVRLQDTGTHFLVILNNGATITVHYTQYRDDEDFIYVEVDNTELLKQTLSRKTRSQVFHDMRISHKQASYTPHVDFQPDKRVVFKPINDIFSKVGHSFPLHDSEGRFGKIENFNVIPRNVMRVKIGEKWCTFDKVTTAKYRYLITSIKNQLMTEEQVIHYTSLLTSVQMCVISTDGNFKSLLLQYARLFFANLHVMIKTTRTLVSDERAWDGLFDLPYVYIPSPVLHFGSELELMQKPLPFPTDIPRYSSMRSIMAETKLYDFSQGEAEDHSTWRKRIIDDFGKSLTISPTATACDLKFDFSVTHSISMIPREESIDLGFKERFVKELVQTRLIVSDFVEACVVVLSTIQDPDEVCTIVKALSARMFHYAVTSNLQRLLMQDVQEAPPHEFSRLDSIDFSYNNFPVETKVARRMQLEYQIFCTELGWNGKKNVFNNIKTIRRIYIMRYSQIKEVQGGWLEAAKKKYADMKEFLNIAYDSKSTMQEINTLWNEKKESIVGFLSSDVDSSLGKTLMTSTDFSTFASSLDSGKRVVNVLFETVMQNLYNLIGIPYTSTFPATTALLYYLVWKNTNNSTLQYLLIVDILGTIGIVDVALATLRATGRIISAIWNKVTTVNDFKDADLQKVLDEMDTAKEEKLDKTKKVLDEMPDPEVRSEDLSLWEKISSCINSNNVAVMGAIAIAIGVAFKLPSNYNMNIIGNGLVQTMKNLSVIGGGALMIPKVYTYLIAAVKWVVDELKGLVLSKHVTKYQLNVKTTSWLRDAAVFMPDQVNTLLARNPDLCALWLQQEDIHAYLLSRTMDMNREIRIEFNRVSKIFMTRAERVHNALIQMFPIDEIFHVQFLSDPGLGKTDVADSIMKTLSESLALGEIDRASTLGPALSKALITRAILNFSTIPDKYNYNDNLKHMDGYVGQTVLYGDDLNMFKNTDPDKITEQIYICSGNSVIASMADLAEKGRPISSKIFVSNTNVAFPRPDGMLVPQALWRRRVLVQVQPIPALSKLMYEKCDVNAVIEKFCNLEKLNRTKSEHLLFNIIVPSNDSITYVQHGNVVMKNLTLEQLKKYLDAKMKLHMATEWDRSITKSPILAKLKLYYTLSCRKTGVPEETMTDAALLKMGEKILSDYQSNCFAEQLSDLVAKSGYEPSMAEEFSAREKKKLASMHDFLKDYAKGVEIDAKMFTREVSGKSTKHGLLYLPNEGGYVLVETVNERSYESEAVNWSNFAFKDITTDGVKQNRLFYKSDVKLNPLYEKSLLGAMLEIESVSSFHQKTFLEKKVRRFQQKPILANFLAEVKFWVSATADATVSLTKWIYNKIVKVVGFKLLNGVFVMLGLMGLFFSAGIVGALLAPEEVSYNQHGKRVLIPGVSKKSMPTPVSANEVQSNILRSCFKVYVQETSFQMLAYTGNIFIANQHSFDRVKFPARMSIADPSTTQLMKEVIILEKDYKPVPNTDYALICINQMRPVKSLRSKWIQEAELADDMINLRLSEGTVVSIRESSVFKPSNESSNRDFLVQGPSRLFTPNDPRANGRHSGRVLALNVSTRGGDSGSVVLHHNNRLPSSVLGIVHQSNETIGITYVAICSREQLDNVKNQFDFKDRIEVNLSEVREVNEHRLKHVFKHNQILKESPFPSQAVDTAPGFKKTAIYGIFPSEVQPALQREDDPRIPPGSRHMLEVSLNKSAGVNTAVITPDDQVWAAKYLRAVYDTWVPNVHLARVLTPSQAITGIKMPGSTSIDVTTSAGLPYKLERGVIGKKPFILYNDRTKEWNIQNRVFNDLEIMNHGYHAGIINHNWKTEYRKHELVGLNKILEPKTRTVGTGNFIQQIGYMTIFKDFHTMTKNVWNEGNTCPFAMGLDPERHWDAVARHVRYIDYVIDFDVKAWEEKMNQTLMNIATKVRLEIIKSSMLSQGLPWSMDYEKEAYASIVDYMHTDVVFEDIVYSKSTGLLSGHPATFMENSEAHEIIFGLACYKILKRVAPHKANIPYILEHCRSIKAADDILIGISPDAREHITDIRLVEEYKNLGYQTTAPDKTPIVTAKTIEEVQFLKNGFALRDGVFEVNPNESQIHQLLNWVRTKTALTHEEQIRVNFGTAMRFAYWKGEDYYETIRAQLNSVCARTQINFTWSSTYDDMTSIIRRDNEDTQSAFLSQKNSDRNDTIFANPDYDFYY